MVITPSAVPFRPCFFRVAIAASPSRSNYVEADTGRAADGCRMILEPPLDHLRIDRGVVQSTAAVPRRDQRLVGARGQRKDEMALVCVRKCCEIVDASVWL